MMAYGIKRIEELDPVSMRDFLTMLYGAARARSERKADMAEAMRAANGSPEYFLEMLKVWNG